LWFFEVILTDSTISLFDGFSSGHVGNRTNLNLLSQIFKSRTCSVYPREIYLVVDWSLLTWIPHYQREDEHSKAQKILIPRRIMLTSHVANDIIHDEKIK
jgi:hypothetical protein